MHGFALLQIVAVALLILANGFFVAAEFALVSMRDTRLERMIAMGVTGATSVRRLQRELDSFLPAVQLGVTLCSLALGWIGEPVAAEVFLFWLQGLPHAAIFAHLASVTLGFCLITYLHVLLGELVPKSLALRRAEYMAIADQLALHAKQELDHALTISGGINYRNDKRNGRTGSVLEPLDSSGNPTSITRPEPSGKATIAALRSAMPAAE